MTNANQNHPPTSASAKPVIPPGSVSSEPNANSTPVSPAAGQNANPLSTQPSTAPAPPPPMQKEEMSPPLDPAPTTEDETMEQSDKQGTSNRLLWIVAIVLLLGVVSILGYLLWLYYGS